MDAQRWPIRLGPDDLVESLFQSVLWLGIAIIAAANVLYF